MWEGGGDGCGYFYRLKRKSKSGKMRGRCKGKSGGRSLERLLVGASLYSHKALPVS